VQSYTTTTLLSLLYIQAYIAMNVNSMSNHKYSLYSIIFRNYFLLLYFIMHRWCASRTAIFSVKLGFGHSARQRQSVHILILVNFNYPPILRVIRLIGLDVILGWNYDILDNSNKKYVSYICFWLKTWGPASDKVYQLLAHGRWFSPGTPASSTTKTGRHDITEILLKVAWLLKIHISSKCGIL
jgi:hypothetical protein